MNFLDKMLELLKTSSGLLGKETIIKPIISRSIFSIFDNLLSMIALTGIVYDYHQRECFIILLIQVLIVIPYSIYYDMKIKTIQSRTTESLLTEENPISFEMAEIESESNKKSILTLAWMFVFIDRYMKGLKEDDDYDQKRIPSFLNKILGLLLSSLFIIIDVAQNFLIPAVILEKKGVLHGISKLKELKSSYAEALTSGLGFQLINSAITPFVIFLQIILLILGLIIGLVISSFLPASLLNNVPEFITSNFSFISNQICYLPVILFLFLGIMFGKVVRIAAESLEVVYYTTFYIVTSKKESIRPEVSKDMESFIDLAKKN